MKLRNLLLSALVFSAGAVFAVDPVTQDDVAQTTYEMGTSTSGGHTQYFYNTSGNNTLTITLLQYSGDATMEKGWTYYAVGYQADGTTETFNEALTLNNANITGRTLSDTEIAGLTTYRTLEAGETLNAYEFTLTFDQETTEKIGFAGRNGDNKKLVFSTVNEEPTNNYHFSDKSTSSILFFGKNAFADGNLKAQIMSSGSYVGNGSGDGTPMGAPLPAPVVTLLIALGFGAALVMYRNRKQANA